MADRYIDQDETQIYGPHVAKMIRSHVKGLIPAFDAALEYTATEIDHATAAVGKAIAASRHAQGGIHVGSEKKGPVLDEARKLLGRFSKHLDTLKGSVDRKLFFTHDGTAGGVGDSAARILLAVHHLVAELAPDKDGKPKHPEVKHGDEWLAELKAMSHDLSPILAHSDEAHVTRRTLTPEVAAARDAFLSIYVAGRAIVEGVLRFKGKLGDLPLVFHDLAVPGGAKVTSIPEVPPPAKP